MSTCRFQNLLSWVRCSVSFSKYPVFPVSFSTHLLEVMKYEFCLLTQGLLIRLPFSLFVKRFNMLTLIFNILFLIFSFVLKQFSFFHLRHLENTTAVPESLRVLKFWFFCDLPVPHHVPETKVCYYNMKECGQQNVYYNETIWLSHFW